MKKVKKILASALLAGSVMGLTACGEVFINFDTDTSVELEKIVYDKDSYKTDINDALSGLSGAKPGYKIEGIYLDEDFTTKFTDIASLKEDITLYVKWTEDDIHVKYNANGGTGTATDTVIKYRSSGMLTSSASVFTKEGYSLVGWNTKADGTGDDYALGAAYFMESTSDVTLYAVWSVNAYKVSFDKNSEDATGANIEVMCNYNSEFTVTSQKYTREDYIIVGWNTKADGTGTTYQAGDEVLMTTKGTTLYAMWKLNNITITFDANEGMGQGNTQKIEIGQTESLIENQYTRVGYTFVGWNTKADGTGTTFNDEALYTMADVSSVTLYAMWDANTYRIAYDKNHANATGVTISANVDFDDSTTITSEVYSLTDYMLVGWNTKADGTGTMYQAGDTITMDSEGITLYAIWKLDNVTITFNANGGDGEMSQQKIKNGVATNLSTNSNFITRAGHRFEGWNTKADGTGETFINGQSVTLNSDTNITLYAMWESVSYCVIYHKNATNAEGDAIVGDTFVGDTFVVTSEEYTRDNHEFVGWNTQADRSGTMYYAGDSVTIGEEGITLYAIWNHITSGLNFDANTGMGSAQTQELALNATYTLPSVGFSKENYTLVGWNTKADGTGTAYSLGGIYTMTSVEDVTLYAMWLGVECTITFNANTTGAEGVVEQTANYNSEFTLTNQKFVKPGYEIVGWTFVANPTNVDKVYAPGDTLLMSNIEGMVLYAKWQATTLPFKDTAIDDMYAKYGTYDYAVIKGLTYTLPDVNIVSITGSVATYNGNTLQVTGPGEFTVRVVSSSDQYKIWDMEVIALANEYDIAFYIDGTLASDTSISWDDNQSLDKTYNYDVAMTLQAYAKMGYTFTGWALKEPAMIGGQIRSAGYIIDRTIPVNSFGNLALEATYEINQYNVVAYDYDFTNSEYKATPYLTITGDYNTSWTTATGYDATKLYTDMVTNTPAGYVFVGWFENPNNETPYDGVISFLNGHNLVDGRIYAKYVQVLGVPTGITVSATTISWDEVAGADYYEIKIEGKTYTSQTNAYVANLESGVKSVSVKACKKIENTGINGHIADASSQFSDPVSLNIQNQNSIIKVKSTTNGVDYTTTGQVFFAGHEYNFRFSSGQAAFEVVSDSLSTDGLIIYTETMDGTVKVLTINTANDKVGTFQLKNLENNELMTVRVVENVARVMKGDTYTNFSSRLQASLDTTADDYQVGAGSGYKYDFVLTDSTMENEYEEYFNDATKSIFKFQVSIDGVNWYDADTSYYHADSNTISTTATGGLSLAVTRDTNDAKFFNFNKAVAPYDLLYKADLYLPYSRTSGAKTEVYLDAQGNVDIAKSELTAVATVTVALNTGVNVYSCQELKDAYGDLNVHVVNIHGDIKPTLSVYQTQADGSPINVESRNVVDSKYHLSSYTGSIPTTENNFKDETGDYPGDEYIGPASSKTEEGTNYANNYKADGNIFRRVDNSMTTADSIVVNGNYSVIDASAVPRINPVYSETTADDSDWGTHNQTGLLQGPNMSGVLPKSQVGIFRYQVPNASASSAIFNNLTIIGNKLTSDQEATYITEDQQREREIINAGSMSGIFAENSSVILNNCTIKNVQNAVRNDGVTYDGKYNNKFNAKTQVNYSQINNTYMSCLYGWCINGIEVYNSRIFNQGGLPIHIADAEGLANNVPYAYIDKNSVIENYITGSESWFNIFGFNQLAIMLKGGIQNTVRNFNGSIIKNMANSTDEYANMIMLYQPQSVKDYNKDGYGSVTKTGGEKRIISGAFDANHEKAEFFAGYVYDANGEVNGWYYYDGGVTSAKDNDIFESGDPRVANMGTYAYAFGQTRAVTTEQFGAYATVEIPGLLQKFGEYSQQAITMDQLGAYAAQNNLVNELNTLIHIATHNTNGEAAQFGTGSTIMESLIAKITTNPAEPKYDLVVQYIMFANSMHIGTEYDESGNVIAYDLLTEVVYQMYEGPYDLPMKVLIGSGMTDELEASGGSSTKAWSDEAIQLPTE